MAQDLLPSLDSSGPGLLAWAWKCSDRRSVAVAEDDLVAGEKMMTLLSRSKGCLELLISSDCTATPSLNSQLRLNNPMISSTSLVEGKKNSLAEVFGLASQFLVNRMFSEKATRTFSWVTHWLKLQSTNLWRESGQVEGRGAEFLLVITVITFVLLSNRNPNPCHVAAPLIGVSTSF